MEIAENRLWMIPTNFVKIRPIHFQIVGIVLDDNVIGVWRRLNRLRLDRARCVVLLVVLSRVWFRDGTTRFGGSIGSPGGAFRFGLGPRPSFSFSKGQILCVNNLLVLRFVFVSVFFVKDLEISLVVPVHFFDLLGRQVMDGGIIDGFLPFGPLNLFRESGNSSNSS